MQEHLINLAREHYLENGVVPLDIESRLVESGLILKQLYKSFEGD
jgi:hypothetical protein